MINPSPILIKQRPYPAGWRQEITFNPGSATTISIRVPSRSVINIWAPENITSWSVAVNGVASVITNSTVRNYTTNDGDVLAITIVRNNSAIDSVFTIGAEVFSQATTEMTLLDWANNLGGNSRYVYALKAWTAAVCIDTSLLTLSNLKTVTAVSNGGTSLTLTVAAHGRSNGDTVSLIDVGGFTADVNHRPWTISNVTTNTFDIPATVTGTWDSVGYLAGAWISDPILATITLPTVTGTGSPWTTLCYRNVDKTVYVFGTGGGAAAYANVCTIDADPASGTFNSVKNWDKTLSNTTTDYSTLTGSSAAETAVYDPIRDRIYCTSVGGSYYLTFGTSTPPRNYVSLLRASNSSNSYQTAALFSYDSQAALFGASNTIVSFNPRLAGYYNSVGVSFVGLVYSQKLNAIFFKSNSAGQIVKRTADDNLTAVSTSTSGTTTWLACGCAVDPLDKLYFGRNTGTFSYSGTTDVMIYNPADNTREDTYIGAPSSGSAWLRKAVYSHYADHVYMVDNGSSARLHIFDTTRASGKKYIGYVNIGGTSVDIIMNNLMWL